MQLPFLNFAAQVQAMAAAVQSGAARLVDLSVGSVLRAVLEANAGLGLWLQWLILRVLQATRAATSTGADLDSFVADFSVVRLPAQHAGGIVTFSRTVPGLAATIPAGTLVRSADGTQDFAVTTNDTLPADALSLDMPVRAASPGAAGNVLAGTVSQLASALPGIDAVTNAAAMAGGQDAEADEALRERFKSFLDTRSRATARAVAYAIATVQQGLNAVIAENQDAAGATQPGHFTVTVDDGSGTPSAALLAAIAAAVEAVRPLGSGYTVRAPMVQPVDVAVTLQLAAGTPAAPVAAAVGAAIRAHLAALPIGAGLPLSRIAQIAHDADIAVLGAGPVLLNGLAADAAPPAHGVLKPGVVVVS